MQYAIRKQEINQKPLLEYTGPVTLIHDQVDVAAAVEQIRSHDLLGFDTETRPAFRKGERYLPSLLQLGTEDQVWLFQIQRLQDLTPVFDLLADPSIFKVGVAIQRDVDELRELHPFNPGSFHDVGRMAEKRGFRNTGLRPLTALLLDHRISKGSQVSNWAADDLNEKQIVYAATDAWVSRKLYLALLELPVPESDPTESGVHS